jgi:hypothetical protein
MRGDLNAMMNDRETRKAREESNPGCSAQSRYAHNSGVLMANQPNQINIQKPSLQSLFLQMQFDGTPIATGTGFVSESQIGPVLITNLHNVTGRNPATRQPLSPTGVIPNEVLIVHNRAGHLGQWVPKVEPLLEEDQPLWIEHPTLGSNVDFVALPLTDLQEVELYPYALGAEHPKIMVNPADTVSVVGFPFGIRSGGALAVWATGHVATEPDVDHNGKPVFLIDCRARQGQSGSAVIAHRPGGMVTLEDGSSTIFNGPVTRFLGIYSGRINVESDLGIVWKAQAIRELVDSLSE